MPKKSETKLKELKSQAQKKLGTIEGLRVEKKNIECRLNKEGQQLNALNNEIKRLEEGNGHLSVTDHAVLRYIERVEKRSIAEIKQRILTPDVLSAHEEFGNGEFPSSKEAGAFSVVVKNKEVVTVVAANTKRAFISNQHHGQYQNHED